MKKPIRRTRLALCTVLGLSALTAGCDPVNWVGPNWFISLNVPLGLGGSPGLLNPFGLVQALVNAAVDGTDDAGGQPSTFPLPGSTGPNVGDLTGVSPTPAPPQPPTRFLP